MTITASMVKELREKTGVGMMACKKALIESNGEIEAAIQHLREKGVSVATKKSDRSTKEGRVFTSIKGDRAAIIELNCETDFVANNDAFIDLGNQLTNLILEQAPENKADLLTLSLTKKTVQERLSEVILQVGENIVIGKYQKVDSTDSMSQYQHANGKIGVLVIFSGKLDLELGKDVAMQIAATNPAYICTEEVPQSELDAEKEILKKQDGLANKPADILDKILTGKLQKYCKEVCLLEQAFIKEDKKSVKEILPTGITVKTFLRYALG